jgi:antitoxin ParD1/3/4
MTTLNISLPDSMKAFIEAQVQSGAYASASDYVRALVRDAQKRQAQEELETKLLAALDSNDFAQMTPDMFERIRERIRQRHQVGQTP